jgi:hypothetical protein
MNYSSSRSYSIRRPAERKHPTQNGLCIEWANTTKTKLPMRWIATPNDNGNSGSSIATPSRLHKREPASTSLMPIAAVLTVHRRQCVHFVIDIKDSDIFSLPTTFQPTYR